MKRALRLARKGTGKVSPNPRVGAVLVKDRKIISEGHHERFGGAHAEINALSKIENRRIKGGTLYTNLEPCCHQGKTPPCTEFLIESGIHSVVIGVVDPNPLVNGKGIRRLRQAGIDVRVGIMEKECIRLNEAYFTYITQKKPFVTLKIAQTLDGKIATDRGLSRWITGETSRRQVHRMRSENDAVLVGVNTVIADDPELSVRSVRGRNPRRIILDSRLRIPLQSRVLADSNSQNTVVATTSRAPSDKIKKLHQMGVGVWILKSSIDGAVDLPALWKKMAKEGITSVLVEGGKEVFTSILNTGDADRIVVFISPKVFGRGIDAFGELDVPSPDRAVTFEEIVWHRRGSDIIFEGRR